MQFLALQAVLIAGNIITWQGGVPAHWTNSWWGIFPLFFLFLSFISGLMGWGFLLQRKVGGGAASIYLLSSVAAVIFAMLMGHLAFLSSSYRWLFHLFLVVGIFFLPKGFYRSLFFLFSNRWLNFLFFYIFGLRFLTAYIPQAHGDSLLYHLMAPRLWTLQGVVKLNQELPIALLASTWEYFYLWPQILFADVNASVGNLIQAQIFSQWIHLTWGLFGSILVLRALIEKKIKNFCELDLALILLSILFVSSMQWTGALAKNDCGIAFWCVGAWFYFAEGISKQQKYFALLGGLLAGLATAGKINAILFLIPLALWIFLKLFSLKVENKKQYSTLFLALALLGFLLGALPIYLRNYMETQNPFYTMFSLWFPSPWISQSWADHFSAHQISETKNVWQMFVYRLNQLSREFITFWFLLFLPILFFFQKTRVVLKEFSDEAFLFLTALLVCVLAVSDEAEVRYLGAALWIGSALGALVAVSFFSNINKTWGKYGKYFLLILFLATSKLPTHLIWKLHRTAIGEAAVREHTGGDAKEWLRNNIKKDRLIVLSGDNEAYYLSNLHVTVLTERPDIDRATYGKKEIKDFLSGLCTTSGAQYLLDVRESVSLAKRFPNDAWDKAILFRGASAKVYDLVKLQNLILKSDFGCGRT